MHEQAMKTQQNFQHKEEQRGRIETTKQQSNNKTQSEAKETKNEKQNNR